MGQSNIHPEIQQRQNCHITRGSIECWPSPNLPVNFVKILYEREREYNYHMNVGIAMS